MNFSDLEIYDFFRLQGDCGEMEMMKINALEGICINSENGTYERGVKYAVKGDDIVIKTC